MTATDYTTVSCSVGRPGDLSVWIALDDGSRSMNLPLSSIHPDDVTEIRAADRWHRMQLRVWTDMAKLKGLVASRPADCDDLFGGMG